MPQLVDKLHIDLDFCAMHIQAITLSSKYNIYLYIALSGTEQISQRFDKLIKIQD